MSKRVKLTVWIAQGEFISGGTVASPLIFPKVTWIDEEPEALAAYFVEVFQERRLEEGAYMEALTALPDLHIASDVSRWRFHPLRTGLRSESSMSISNTSTLSNHPAKPLKGNLRASSGLFRPWESRRMERRSRNCENTFHRRSDSNSRVMIG